ncbi:MAG: LuxR C-terminal-related transcriptional regulator, partial [Dysgonamonadaceae bacterium]|nr:LuxR C-terminal-related transcriptional regulator [Dysgonamonadaceae bacterium]
QLEAEKARNEAVAANIHLEHQTKFMAEAQEKLKESEIDSAEIEQLFKNEKIIDKEISNFKQFISDISPQFVQLLEQKAAPGRLTNDEIKLASCVAMKMDNKQIADIFGISQDYVRTKKARLKKKLNLSYEENLSDLAGDSFQNS